MMNLRRLTRTWALTLIIALFCLCAVAAHPLPAHAATQEITDLVVFVRFQGDESLKHSVNQDWPQVKAMLTDNSAYNNGVDDSFSAYISAISEGQLTVQVVLPQEAETVVNQLELEEAISGYAGDFQLVTEVIAAINAGQISLPEDVVYDQVEQGVLDNLLLIVQGKADDDQNSWFYPHKAVYGGGEKFSVGQRQYLVRNYNLIDSAALFETFRAQGVVSHEFLHSVGLPDLYRYETEGDPVGIWDIMGQVSRYQQYPLVYQRHVLGWLDDDDLPTLTPAAGRSQSVTLDLATLTTEQAENPRGYMIKTPLSDQEFFVLEYRRQLDAATSGFETKLPDQGLLIYRVNQVYDTNEQGDDYIYVFRPDETGLGASGGYINAAALTPWLEDDPRLAPGPAVHGYGSDDLEADFSAGTLFYADGRNSGVTISDLYGDPEGVSLSFTVNFPDYDSMELWRGLGGTAAESCFSSSLAVAADGTLYLAGDAGSNIYVGYYDQGQWQALASPGPGSRPQLAFVGDRLVAAYTDNWGYDSWTTVRLKQYVDGQWIDLGDPGGYRTESDDVQLVGDGQRLFLSYYEGSGMDAADVLAVRSFTVEGETTLASGPANLSADAKIWINNPALALYQGELYVAYSLSPKGFNQSTATPLTRIDKLTEDGFEPVYVSQWESSNHRTAVGGDRLYLLSGNYGDSPRLYEFDGSEWSASQPLPEATAYSSLALTADASRPYLGLVSGSDSEASVYWQEREGVWSQLNGVAATQVNDWQLVAAEGTIYAPLTTVYNLGGDLKLYSNDLPPGDSFTVSPRTGGARVELVSGSDLRGRLLVAFYQQGRLLGLAEQNLAVSGDYSASHQLTLRPRASVSQADCIKALLVDADLRPLLPAAVWEQQ